MNDMNDEKRPFDEKSEPESEEPGFEEPKLEGPEHEFETEGRPLDLGELLFRPEELPEDHRSGYVAVIGRPNVGKSTLLNRLLGQKIAITSPKPQTTRDQILGILTTDDAQFIFLDTPGIHQPKHKLGKHMVNVAERTIAQDADLVLWVVDVNSPPREEERLIAERLGSLHRRGKLPPVILALNKVDQWQGSSQALSQRAEEYRALLDWLSPEERAALPVYPISALTGLGVGELLEGLRERLPRGPRYFPPDQVTDLQTRFIVAELIREQALNLLRQEVPHSIAVSVTDFKEREDGTIYIAATIYVERRSQKGIVLGHKGAMIKQIGQAARAQIEEMLGRKVYLELWVKVWEKWRKKENMLRRLGYDALH